MQIVQYLVLFKYTRILVILCIRFLISFAKGCDKIFEKKKKMECVKVDITNNRTIYTHETVPEIENETDVIVKVSYAGVCGTDLHIIQVIYNFFFYL